MVASTRRHIIWFDEVKDKHLSILGSKGAALARLYQAGFPVPRGFCISSEAFIDCVGPIENAFPTSIGEDPSSLQDTVLAMTLPPEMDQEILENYRRMAEGYGGHLSVAVRSSSSEEDLAGASYAGQYDSVLNVGDENQLCDAVKTCWGSLFSSHLIAYQSRSNSRESGPRTMAVVVQEMVDAEIGGILFTVDPVKGDRDIMVVEVAPRTVDGVTAGRVSVDRFVFERRTLKAIGSQGHCDVPGKGTCYKNVDLAPLLTMALKIEKLMDSPQDIEWVYRDGTFWILQSRPVTGLTTHTPRQIYTRANAGEIMPGVVTPLTWSIFKPVLQMAGMYRALSHLTIHWRWRHPTGQWPESPRLFKGRAYMELASVYAGFAHLPGVNAKVLRKMLGFEFHLCRADEFPDKRPRWHIMDPYRYLRFWLEMVGITHTLTRQAKKWLHPAHSDIKVLPPSMERKGPIVLAHAERLIREAARILGLHIQCTSMAFSAYGLVGRLITKYFTPDEVRVFQTSMIADFQSISTVQQNIAIWDLATTIGDSRVACDMLFQSQRGWHTINALRTVPEAIGFIGLWDHFIDRFGDRGTEEFELSVPHWNEDPSFVLAMVKEIVKETIPDPRIRLEEQRVAWHSTKDRLYRSLRSRSISKSAILFRRIIDVYGALVPLRENLKYALVARFNLLRKDFILLSKMLEDEGLLADRSDIFFLRYEEVRNLFANGHPQADSLKEVVRNRREEGLKDAEGDAPPVWVACDGAETPLDLPLAVDGRTIRGVGCSQGIITGRAYILIPGKEKRFPAGRIIVAPSIDPGLTPFFLSAIGLVTEIGGVLSHGATVAREFGLPAVVAVPHATSLIEDGQEITIDGYAGIVYLTGQG